MRNLSENELTTNELERANEVISQFINSCSHSMRGPLKSINGLVHLLHRSKDYTEAETETFLNLIEKTTQKMENMLDELEQLLENSKRKTIETKINWHNLISTVVARYQKQIESSGIKIGITIAESAPFFTDAERVYLILSHLIENAIHFQCTARRERYINIAVQGTHKINFIEVSDNGIGIDENAQGKIFQLFYRATQKSEGVGAGLYIVDEAVRKLGGKIMVESVPDQGSTFIVSLPNLNQTDNELDECHISKDLISVG
jgi:signal transduction histidine kinase